MEQKVKPENGTNIHIDPSEEPGYCAALCISNEYVDAVLLLTEEQVRGMIAHLAALL